MKIILACAAVLALATGCDSPSYDDQVVACQKAMTAHDFDAHPLAEGKRLPECDALAQDDYDALSLNVMLGGLGWLDEDGNFDKNKMLDSLDN